MTTPPIRRVSFSEHAAAAGPAALGPDERGAVVIAAERIGTLQSIQLAFDQAVRHVEDDLRIQGGSTLSDGIKVYLTEEVRGAGRHAAVLATASRAAESMIADFAGQLRPLGLDLPAPPDPPEVAALKAQLARLTQDYGSTKARVAELESQAAATPKPKPAPPAPKG